VVGLLGFLTFYFVTGSIVFDLTFLANPNVQGGAGGGCYGINRDSINPSNLHRLGGPCGYTNLSKTLFLSLNVPRNNWTYVDFPSRVNNDANAAEPILTIRGIFMARDIEKDPFVILVHGIRACKEDKSVLIPAAMLWRNNFNVLLVDLRNHGQSQVSKYAYATFGDQEHFDVLGAVDYLLDKYPRLKNKKNVIGLMGASMGGATSAIAFAQDGGVNLQALYLDSPALYVKETLNANFERFGFSPPFVMSAICSVERTKWTFGCPPFQYDPMTKKIGTRHVYISSKIDDRVVPLKINAMEAEKVWREQGVNVTTRFVLDTNQPASCTHHVDTVFYEPVIFEQQIVQFFNDHLQRL
jgi:pimeloyl-ACP methyl ester carboxylesterase